MKSEKKIVELRNYIKNAIINNRNFNGHKEERCQVFELLLRVVQNGESNSALLIGPRGSGKTTLLKDVLSELQNDDEFSRNSITVKLHGLVHTDDRLALRSITSQMNLENVVDGKVFGSFAENMAFLLACLRTGQKHTSKSVIFILEEFDLFCSHHNQTLLYNLFDVSQSAQAPICVLGITCRLDVIELLEKRVKSRFSHRQIFLFPGIENEEQSDLEHMLSKLEQYLLIPEKSDVKISMAVKKQWNADIKSLLNDKKFKSLMQRLSEIDISERTLRHILINIIFRLDEDKLSLKVFQDQMDMLEKDDMIQILQDLNVVELCLVIAMKHHDEIYENQPMNFEMILTRYIKFANANSSIQSMPRPVIMKAFEHIQIFFRILS
nr:origin recognition complex subunit 4 isoform X2 [Leptinotarsa decemlineata]